MKISYLVTCSTETDTLQRLLECLGTLARASDDELVIIIDEDAQNNQKTKDLLAELASKMGEEFVIKKTLKIYQHPLNANYGEHKNFGNSKCTGDYIFQIDGDELPNFNIIDENLKLIIESNPAVELIYVPRINDYRGVKEEHARTWGWRLTPSPSCENRPVVNWPDYQGRIYKREPERIRWDRKLHEKIEGHKQYSFLPAEEEYALYHDKTIEKQLETNYRYNKVFSEEDNKGHKVT